MLKNPAFRFLLLFALCMAVYFALYMTPFYEQYVVLPLAKINSTISGILLDLMGFDNVSHNSSLKLADSAGVNIDSGCLALEPAAIYISSLLAFPSGVRKKLQGLVIGVGFLLSLNLLRIMGLALIQKYYPDWFDFMHYEFFQVLFLVLAVLAWFVWIRWTPGGKKAL